MMSHVTGDISSRVGREVDGTLTLLVQYFNGILISEFRDAVSNTATGDCILTRLLDAWCVGVLDM